MTTQRAPLTRNLNIKWFSFLSPHKHLANKPQITTLYDLPAETNGARVYLSAQVHRCTVAPVPKEELATKATALPAGHLAKVSHVCVPVLLDRDKLSLFREED